MAESTRARTAMEERARIARELHDIVAHHLSVITIASEAARLTSPALSGRSWPVRGDRLHRPGGPGRNPPAARRSSRGQRTRSRPYTTARTRRTRRPDRQGREATGTSIPLVREGTVVGLPLGVDLAAYRIVQEALTNARRHAPGATVDVKVSYREHALHLHIRDDGPGTANGAPVEGHGLMGMRERATLAGGTFCIGPAEGGGFEVLATLPTTARSL